MGAFKLTSGGPILVTGSEGLIGTELIRQLGRGGHESIGFDLRAKDIRVRGDILDERTVRDRLAGCEGVVHLAAVSRVKSGEAEPELCMRTNFEGTSALVRFAKEAGCKWFLYASSREVYGRCDRLPATENSPILPVNVYGVSKARAEEVVRSANSSSFSTGIARFSNVFGDARDHIDRVVPAFMRGALTGGAIRLDGPDSLFDFTFVDDVVEGVIRYVDKLRQGKMCVPLHFVSENPTSLHQLAEYCREICGRTTVDYYAPARTYDVSKFWGDGANARCEIGWTHSTSLFDSLSVFRDRLVSLHLDNT